MTTIEVDPDLPSFVFIITSYKLDHLIANLGWVDLDLESSPAIRPLLELLAAQAGWWNNPNLSQLNPDNRL